MRAMFFFLHIPRTAGTTLNAILKNNFRAEEILSVYDRRDYEEHAAHSAEELARVRLIQGHLLLQQYDPPLMYGQPVRVFTFLRDPLARLASEYSFLRTWPPNHLYAYLNDNNISFRQYLESREQLLVYRGKNFMIRSISGMDTGHKPYPVKALSRAKRNLESVFGCFGIQERFMESLVLLGKFMGLTNLLHEKRNALREGAKPVLSEEDKAVAEEYNRGDRELYAFARDLFTERVSAGGEAFQEKVRALEFMNGKYQKIAGLLMREAGQEDAGLIDKPKDGLDGLWR